jgi:hypothetical protein
MPPDQSKICSKAVRSQRWEFKIHEERRRKKNQEITLPKSCNEMQQIEKKWEKKSGGVCVTKWKQLKRVVWLC